MILLTIFREKEGNSLLDSCLPYVQEHISLCLCKKDLLLGQLGKVKEIINKYHPDVIHSVGVLPSYLAQKYAKRVHFITVRNYAYEDLPAKHGNVVGKVLVKIQMKVIRECRHKVACSQSLADMYKQHDQISMGAICNGIDIQQYVVLTPEERMSKRKDLNLPIDKVIFVYAAQVNLRKNQAFAIAALLEAKRKDVCLVLLGDGPMLLELQTRYGKNQQIIMPGEVSNVKDYLYASDIYFSTSGSEGMPNGVLEAMACGLPVLLSDIPQHQEIIALDLAIRI